MKKEDIIAGLKQAMERGESLEKAKLTFINAGYPVADVEDSANYLQLLISNKSINLNIDNQKINYSSQLENKKLPEIPKYGEKENQENILIQPAYNNQKTIPLMKQEIEKKTSNKTIKILIGIIVFLLIILGASYFFKDKIISFFNK
ncbi:MAG: hypothetical protein QW117_01955 [Candidatus Pacearchaeota archaeon]